MYTPKGDIHLSCPIAGKARLNPMAKKSNQNHIRITLSLSYIKNIIPIFQLSWISVINCVCSSTIKP